jgi:DNA-binding NtrC family response regulator
MRESIKLLVVDDEIDVCNFVKSFFQMRGLHVITALNGDEALAVLDKEKPDMVILDIIMRTENEGLEYLPRIKAALPTANVLIVTGMEDEKMMQTAKNLGACGTIQKPLVLEYLETTVFDRMKDLHQIG